MFWFFRRKGQKGSCFVCADSSPGLTALITSAVPPAPSMSAPARLLALAASPRLRSAASETPRGQAEAEIPPELPSEPDPDAEAQVQAAAAAADSETEEEKARRLLYCSLCKVAVNSASQLEAHNSGKRRDQPPPPRGSTNVPVPMLRPGPRTGTKHKTMLEARTGAGSIKSFPRPGVKSKLAPLTKSTGLQNKTFYCQTCDVHVNSDTQLKQVGEKPARKVQFISDKNATSRFQNKTQRAETLLKCLHFPR